MSEDLILKIVIVSIFFIVINICTISALMYMMYGKKVTEDKDESNHIISTPGARFETKTMGKGQVVKKIRQ